MMTLNRRTGSGSDLADPQRSTYLPYSVVHCGSARSLPLPVLRLSDISSGEWSPDFVTTGRNYFQVQTLRVLE